ncbi:hypothetical protein [Polaromonas sp. YR568]|uniref:hypothetical protein n=1 Tax=Polaromonas sp. YR568 TaxID=1855301 RepID=UPI00313795E0
MTKQLGLMLIALAIVGCGDRTPTRATTTGVPASACASHRPVALDEAKVPPQFKDLIPLARQWGISDDSARSTCIAESSAADRQALATTLADRATDLHRWLDEIKPGQTLTDEQSAFLYMLNALETIDAMQSSSGQAK